MKGRHMPVRMHDTSKSILITDEYGSAGAAPAVIKSRSWYVDATFTHGGLGGVRACSAVPHRQPPPPAKIREFCFRCGTPIPSSLRTTAWECSNEQETLESHSWCTDKPLVIGEIEIPAYVLEGEQRVLTTWSHSRNRIAAHPGAGFRIPQFMNTMAKGCFQRVRAGLK